jgi:hypothetical protein
MILTALITPQIRSSLFLEDVSKILPLRQGADIRIEILMKAVWMISVVSHTI